jgi:hypothetical protein
MRLSSRLHEMTNLLTPGEVRALKKLGSPAKIQDFLDTLPINFEIGGETYMSPRRTLEAGTAHCFEGALLAATALLYHGEKPLLMDLRTIASDEDHVVTLFREGSYWGAISKTNHPVLRYRDAVYKNPRELAMSYFHEYVMDKNAEKTLREYSKPFDLSRYELSRWLTAPEELQWLVDDLDDSQHYSIASASALRKLRLASEHEVEAMRAVEWKKLL